MSSGWLGTFFPGEALPLDEPRLTGFEALNPLLGRARSPAILRSRTPSAAALACGFPAKRCRGADSGWLGARISGGLLLRDEPRSPPPLWCADFRWNPFVAERF